MSTLPYTLAPGPGLGPWEEFKYMHRMNSMAPFLVITQVVSGDRVGFGFPGRAWNICSGPPSPGREFSWDNLQIQDY